MSRSERPIVFPGIEPFGHGMLDVGDSQQIYSPLETAWRLHANWRSSRLEIVEDAGHGGEAMLERIVAATSDD
jgi:hypothetical protein